MSPRIRQEFRRSAAALAAAALCAASGCHRHAAAAAPSRPAGASPVVAGETSGLEVWSWLVSDPRNLAAPMMTPDGPADVDQPEAEPTFRIIDDRPSLESVLAPYLDRPIPVSKSDQKLWKTCGFRIVAIPASQLEPLQDRMRLVGQVQRQWLGELPKWTAITRGPDLPNPQPVAMDDGTLILQPGRTSLVARCWSTPVAIGDLSQTAPALRLQLVPQHEPRVDDVDRWRAAAGIGPDIQAQRFARLALDLLLTQHGEAYLITADDPATDWATPEKSAAAAPEAAGPVAPRAPTLGELMLSSPGNNTKARVRAVVVLVPRIPTRFDLLP